MVFQVILLLVFLKYGLELGIAVWIIRGLAVGVLIQHLIGHVLACHGMGILFDVGLHERITFGIAVAMDIFLAEDRVKF
ncbi:MAG: hypothetical protein MJZ73_04685 [Bacteroidaceae bacterium]|nr:hypothetical protein [Bacteroidaceae bacterium]